MAAPGCALPSYAGVLPRALDEEPERVPVADDLPHRPDGVAVGLASANGEGAEEPHELRRSPGTRCASTLAMK